MKKWIAGLCLVVLGLTVFAAGVAGKGEARQFSYYREETVTKSQFPQGGQMSLTTRAWIVDDKMRTEIGDGNDVTILRADQDVVYSINLKRKTYSETPLSVYRKAARLSLAMLGAEPTYQWTKRQRKIGAWSCREVVLADETSASGDRMQTAWWVTQDIGLDRRVFRHVMTLTSGSDLTEAMARFFEKLANIDGFPVQTESSYTRAGVTYKTVNTLVKLEKREIKDEMFELPPGLTKVVVPLPDVLQQ